MQALTAKVQTIANTETINNDLLAAFINSLDVSQKTRETYTRALKQYALYLQGLNLGVLNATRQTVLDYKQALIDTSKKPATINAYLSAVKQLYKALEGEGIMPNICANLKGLKRAKQSSKDALTLNQAKAILNDIPANKNNVQALRDYAMINLLLRRGLRTIEIMRANIEDMRQINGRAVLYVQGKGYTEKNDFVILSEECLAPIYDYLAARGSVKMNEPLFAGIGNRNKGGRLTTRAISKTVKTMLQKHGINSPAITAHSLRHTAITLALLNNAKLQDVQAFARHANIQTTLIYAHNLNRLNASAESAIDAILRDSETTKEPINSNQRTSAA